MTALYIILALLILMFMITVHEVGHYLAAKILGFRVHEFAEAYLRPVCEKL